MTKHSLVRFIYLIIKKMETKKYKTVYHKKINVKKTKLINDKKIPYQLSLLYSRIIYKYRILPDSYFEFSISSEFEDLIVLYFIIKEYDYLFYYEKALNKLSKLNQRRSTDLLESKKNYLAVQLRFIESLHDGL